MSQQGRRTKFSFTERAYPLIMAVVSLVAIIATFGLASSPELAGSRSKGFSAIIVGYLVVAFVIHVLVQRFGTKPGSDEEHDLTDAETEEKLFAIEEASEYFGGTLKSDDMFRLVSNKINEILPFTACVLYLADRSTDKIRIVQAQGANAALLRDMETGLESGLAGRCVATGLAQIDRGMTLSDGSVPAEALAGFRSSAAVPLTRSGEVFAVLQLFSDLRTAFDGNAVSTLEAVAERVTPIILRSLSFERSVSSALTDLVTDLPNERAFQLVLENQIAESQRKRLERPLTILAIDVKDFGKLNSKFGHAAGDRLLNSIAQVVKGQLRQMDFFARASDDEFLAILPTADEEVAADVVARINTAMYTSRFFVNDTQTVEPELYFGTASFGIHGETADPLILAARLQKQQSKANTPVKVVMFPKQFVN